MKTHTGESIYKCTECDDSGVQDGNLKSHMRTYTREKPCKCTECDYWCIQDRHLKRHLKTNTGEKFYKCTECDCFCIQVGNLNSHIRIHSGEILYMYRIGLFLHTSWAFEKTHETPYRRETLQIIIVNGYYVWF